MCKQAHIFDSSVTWSKKSTNWINGYMWLSGLTMTWLSFILLLFIFIIIIIIIVIIITIIIIIIITFIQYMSRLKI